jgi:hypothetical protein
VIVRIATVDEGEIPPPQDHIWTSHAPPWDLGQDQLPHHPEARPE